MINHNNIGHTHKRKKKKEGDEWSCVSKDDFFKASDKEIAERERKRQEAEAKRNEEEVVPNDPLSILRKKGNHMINHNTNVKISIFFGLFKQTPE